MDKYEELEDYILNRKSDCEENIKSLQEAITKATFDNQEKRDYLYLFADSLKEYCRRLKSIENKYKKFMLEEDKIRKMLDGFHDDGCMLNSFIYASITLRPQEDYPAQCGDKFFDTIEKAKEYSISLGKREDWLRHAYAWLSEEEDLEKLIEDIAVEYADDNKEYILVYGSDMISDYYEIKEAFIDGFKAGLKFKEEELT